MDKKVIKFKEQKKKSEVNPIVPVMIPMPIGYKEKLEKQADKIGITLEQFIMVVLTCNEKEVEEFIKENR